MSLKGKAKSPEHRRKLSIANLGKHIISEETRTKLRTAHLGKKRKPFTKETRLKIGQAHSNEKQWAWKGEKAGYGAKHDWIRRRKGRPQACSHCDKTSVKSKIEWANIDHKYKRDINLYISLCCHCHRIYDDENGLRKPN